MSGSSFGHRVRTRVLRVSLVSMLAGAFVATGADVVDVAVAAEPSETPAVQMRDFAPDDFTDQAAQLPDDLVAAVRRDLDISAQEYLARAATARHAATVVDSMGSVVRSAWLVDDDLHIAVAGQDDAATVRAAGAEAHVGDGLTDALAAARAQDKLAYVDRRAGRVVPVDVGLEGEPLGRSGLVAQAASWGGGSGFAVSDLLMDYRCSTGFAGTSEDGAPRILTAGHCGSTADGLLTSPVHSLDLPQPVAGSPDLRDTWPEHIGDAVGEFDTDSFVFGAGQDAGLIDVTDEEWDLRPEVASPASGDADGVPVLDSAEPIAGAVVCSSGSTSGWRCGHILATGTTAQVSGEDVTGFLFDACVLPGDSGGAIMTGPYALGINSGSTWQAADCANGEVAAAGAGTDVSLGYAISGETDSVEELYGDTWDLLVHVGTPTVTSPGQQATVGSTPTISGTVEAAAGATVEISVDGASPLEATVGPAGRWSVAVAEALDPGTHDFEATATHTSATSDIAAVGEATTGTFEVATVASLNPTWPRTGDTTSAMRPTFTGTGQPGATVELQVGADVHATTTVSKDGSWSITPDNQLAAGRFDVVLTQQPDGEDASSVTVREIGLKPGSPVITSPRPGEAVEAGHRVSGVGAPGATVSLRVQPNGESAPDADGQDVQVRADDDGAWSIELGEDLADGSQTVVATQAVDGLASEPSPAVSFAVDQRVGTARSGGTLTGFAGRAGSTDAAAPDSSLPWAWVGAALLAAVAVVLGTAWRRRVTSH